MEAGVMERRHSTDSNDSSNCSKQGDDGSGRVLKPTTPKPPSNALQFIKTGPCDLYRKAQEQIKKSEQIKKEKQTMRNDSEEWQSNLDNWKSSRRKMQEHIIERVVEVKKFELEEHERSRRRTNKTFSEMMQERGRKPSIPVYDDESANDFSDLGLSSNNLTNGNLDENLSSNDSSLDNEKEMIDEEVKLSNGDALHIKPSDCNGNGALLEEESTEEEKEPPSDKEEYTYERAIQNYVNFAETRVKSLSARSIPEEVKSNGASPVQKELSSTLPSKPRRSVTSKVDSIFNKTELYRKSVSTTDLTESTKKVVPVPKVDISKRRELFEKIEPEDKTNKISRSTVDLNSSKSIKERLSFLEKNNESNRTKSLERPSPEISVKARLSNIENLKCQDSQPLKASKSNEITSTSIKDRLSHLEKLKATTVKQVSNIDSSTSIKDRLCSLQSACTKEVSKVVLPKPNSDFHDMLNTFQEIEASGDEVYPLSEGTEYGYSSEDLFDAKKSMHFRHRSLDSLDVDDSPVSNETFERVQSYEDLDYCRNYPASSVSGDTDREDSGIHTADVSSSVSQADDFDLHLDSNLSDDIKIAHQHPIPVVSEELKTNTCKSPTVLLDNVSYLRCEVQSSSPSPRAYTKLDCSSPLPAILENPAEFNSTVDIVVVNTCSPPSSPTYSSHGDVDHLNHFSYEPADLSSSSASGLIKPEPRTSIPSDLEQTIIEVCERQPSPEANAPQPFSTLYTQSSTDTKNFNGLDGKNVSNSSEATLVEIEEISNDTESLDKDLLLDEEPCLNSFKDLSDQSDIVSTTNQIMILHSRDQVSQDSAPPQLPIKPKEIIPVENKVECLVLDSTVIDDSGSVFPISPTALEPPKEKPPPPPMENSDDEMDDINKPGAMRRMDSAKRIKKEIRLKRSSFLGLDGTEDNYTDPEVELARPPDLTALLTEERRLERQLYRQSLCSETDSNQESRDSGVELDNKPSDPWVSHSRTNSDNFGNQSTTSDEDDIMKKEREIIETLEQEERIRKQQLGEKLAMRLRELEAVEKDTLELQRIYSSVDLNNHMEKTENSVDMNPEQYKENYGRDMEKRQTSEGMWYDHSSDTESVREPGYLYSPSPPVSPHRNQQSLERQSYERPVFQMAERQVFQPPERQAFQMAERQAFQPPERQIFQKVDNQGFQPAERTHCLPPPKRHPVAERQSVHQPEPQGSPERQVFIQPTVQPQVQERSGFQPPPDRHQFEQNAHYQKPVQRQTTRTLPHEKSQVRPHPGTYTFPYRSSYSDLTQTNDIKEVHRRSMPELQALTRRSMPDLQQTTQRPVPELRRPPPPALPAKPNHLTSSSQIAPQPMTRTTKQALSAAPRSRIISNESWQAKRKPKQENCNYQHWLIQEAEHRRITEQQKRQSNVIYSQMVPQSQQHQIQHAQMQQQPSIQQIQQPLQQQWSGHKPIYTSTPAPPQWTSVSKREKPLPDSIIQTLTQRVQNRKPDSNNNRRRYENVHYNQNEILQEKVLSVSGKKRCSACGDELGRGAAMIIESLQLFYHIDCFKCCVCCMQLGDGLMGTDVRVRNNKLHCQNCYSSDDGAKFSCV